MFGWIRRKLAKLVEVEVKQQLLIPGDQMILDALAEAIKSFDLSRTVDTAVRGTVVAMVQKSDIKELTRTFIAENPTHIIESVAGHIDLDGLARCFDTDSIAKHIEVSDIVNEFDYDDVAERIDVDQLGYALSSNESFHAAVASAIDLDYSELYNQVDISDLADEITADSTAIQDIAGCLAESLGSNIKFNSMAMDQLDYKKLATSLLTQLKETN